MKNTFVLFVILLCGDAFAAASSDQSSILTLNDFKGHEAQIAAFAFDMTEPERLIAAEKAMTPDERAQKEADRANGIKEETILPNGMFPRGPGADYYAFIEFLKGKNDFIAVETFSKVMQDLQEDATGFSKWAKAAASKSIVHNPTILIIAKMEAFFEKHGEVLSVFYRPKEFVTHLSELAQTRQIALVKLVELKTGALDLPDEIVKPESPRKRTGILHILQHNPLNIHKTQKSRKNSASTPSIHFDASAALPEKKIERLTPRTSSSDAIVPSALPTSTMLPIVPLLPLGDLHPEDEASSIELQRKTPDLDLDQSIRGLVEAGGMTPDPQHKLACYIDALKVIGNKGDPVVIQRTLEMLEEYFKTI